MAWLTGWSYRKTVTITGQSGAGTDYQVDLSIGDASGGDFHVESNCTSFPNDIQVTDNDQTTPIDYWVEDLTVDPITMWVEVADDLGSNVDVCIYYGKSGEPTSSNITNTFLFGDDFPGSSIDTDKWAGDIGSASVAGGILTLASPTKDWKKLNNKVDTYGVNYAIGSKIALPAYGASQFTICGFTETAQHNQEGAYFLTLTDGYTITNFASSSQTTVYYTNDTSYHTLEIERLNTGNHYYKDGTEITNSPLTTDVTTANLNLLLQAYDRDLMIDWICLRKYNSPEPTFSSASGEETEAPAYIPYPFLSGMDGGIGEVMGGGIRR